MLLFLQISAEPALSPLPWCWGDGDEEGWVAGAEEVYLAIHLKAASVDDTLGCCGVVVWGVVEEVLGVE